MVDVINKNTLKPGDVVGVGFPVGIGFGRFRYVETVPMTIERITPSRRKFVMTNGKEFDRYEPFYLITEEVKYKTHIAKCAKAIRDALYKLDTAKLHNELYTKDDETIAKVAELLGQIIKTLEVEC